MLPGVQIAIVFIVAISLFGALGSIIWLLFDLVKSRHETEIKRNYHLSEATAQKIVELAKKELSKQRNDNIRTKR